MQIKYRPDVDGLRAVAVVIVVFFHASFPFFDGGFVGVDVFFVISGYLITSIILAETSDDKFSFIRFYERRIRRLAPAMVPVLVLTFGYCFVLFDQEQFSSFAKSVIAFFLFTSNWNFLSETGYFDAAAFSKPLLHTWSLSIEEQYYLVFPLILYSLRKHLFVARYFALALAICSFFYCVYLIEIGALSEAFYNSFARMWEIIFGSLIALFPRARLSSKLASSMGSILGFALITIATFWYTEEMRFPGIAALLPVVGAGLIIASTSPHGPIYRILTLTPVNYVGRLSYSLYLWHWVLLVLTYSVFGEPDGVVLTSAVFLSFLVSILSFHFIEQPFRRNSKIFSRQQVYSLFATGAAAIVLSCASIIYFSGLPQRVSFFWGATSAKLTIEVENAVGERRKEIRTGECHRTGKIEIFLANNANCIAINENKKNVLLIGDSHAADVYMAVNSAYPDVNFLQLTGAGCGIGRLWVNDSAVDYQRGCPEIYDLMLSENLLAQVDGILISSRYNELNFEVHVPEDVTNYFAIRGYKGPIAFFGPTLEFSPPVKRAIRMVRPANLLPTELNSALQKQIEVTQFDVSSFEFAVSQMQMHFIAKADFVCPESDCEFYDPELGFLSLDYGHWTYSTAKAIGQRIKASYPTIEALLVGSTE